MRTRRRIALAALCAAILLGVAPASASGAAPEIETAVSATRVEPGETFTFQLRLRGDATSSEPDLSPLSRDFDVQGVRQTHRASFAHGSLDSSVDYAVQLAARREGDLEIPALPVGSAASAPVRIHVEARAAAPPGDASVGRAVAAGPVIVEAHADRTNPYEHERVILTIELYAEGEIYDGALAQPEIPGLALEQLGEDRRIEKWIDGRRYAGIERSYVLIPDASGPLVVPPVRFEGRVRVAEPAPRRRPRGRLFGRSLFHDFFGDFFGSNLRTLTVRSEPLRLEVRERPDAVAGEWWLPARDVSLKETLEPDAGPVRVGEPITRRIEIRADGASPSQLPALEAPEIEGVKRYAEAPQVEESLRGSVRVDETTLIPTQPGFVTLPAVELAWWDTASDTAREALLPARTLEVLPPLAVSPGARQPAAAAAPSAERPLESAPAGEGPPAPAQPAPSERPAWRELAALGLGAAIASALILLGVGFARRRRRARKPPEIEPALSPRAAARALRRACRRNDAAGAEAALRALGRLRGETPEPLAGEIARLLALRYSGAGTSWQGAPLWAAWRAARKARRSGVTARHDGLPPLYPTA